MSKSNNLDAYFGEDYVRSERVLYTPSSFARNSLIHLQEIGELHAVREHVSKREGLDSYLFFMVLSGSGALNYNGASYSLSSGDCVFIDCTFPYSHQTSDDLWSLKWVHFYGPQMANIYHKYMERGGKPAFTPANIDDFDTLWHKLRQTSSTEDYIRDMRINEGLNELLTLLMQESWNPAQQDSETKRSDLISVKEFLGNNYADKISLDLIADKFYINKYYLTRIFKEQFGVSINQYLLQIRITHAKHLLRFTDETVENIGWQCGIGAPHYFARTFKKVEGISPGAFRKKWRN